MPTTVLLILERVAVPGRLRIAFATCVLALAVWTALSATWSITSAGSFREAERMLVYVAVALAVAAILRRGDEAAVVAGALLGISLVSAYALGTRLLPDRFHAFDDPTQQYRLSAPVGYWNALGLFAVLGMLLALGLVAHARRRPSVVAAGVVLPVLATTTYFTFSRGAWGGLALGFVAMVALDPRRLRLLWTSLLVLPASGVCVLVASRQRGLTTEGSPADLVLRQGHRQAAVTLGLVALSAALGLAARLVADRVQVSRRTRRAVDVALASLAAAAIVAGVAVAGGPAKGVSRLREKFDAGPTAKADLNTRLFSISGNGRAETIRVAWENGLRRPLAGSGAGSFEYVWYEHRPSQLVVRDAHSLYVETFSELGLVGVALLGGIVMVPLLAAVRGRRVRCVPAAAGAFVAWAGASSLDWHWEVAGLTMTALLAAGVGLIAAERGRAAPLGAAARLVGAGTGVVLSVLAVVSLVGNQALFAGKDALARKDWLGARADADRARSLLPWSFEPHLVLGDAAAGLGDRTGAANAYRDATAMDPRNWVAWLRLAQVARGTERTKAYAKVRELNPREANLPGAKSPSG